IAAYTIKAVEDPRTLNKKLYLKPPANILTLNELIPLWEKKIGKTLEKTYVPEDQLLKQIQESPFPLNLILALAYSTIVKKDGSIYDTENSSGVEASQLYPEVKYRNVDQYLDCMV
ncbi:hypothetical protein UlMin_043101, partial [Ulmus minor]